MKNCNHVFRVVGIISEWWTENYFIIYKCSHCKEKRWGNGLILNRIDE